MTDRPEPCEHSGLDPRFCAHCRGHHTVVHIDDVERILGRPAPAYRWHRRITEQQQGRRLNHDGTLIQCTTAHDRHDRPMCISCETLFETMIGDIPAIMENVDQAMTRQTRFVDHGTTTTHPDEAPLGLHLAASKAAVEVRDTLVYPDLGARGTQTTATATATAARQSRWMLNHWTDVMRDTNIAEVAEDISRAVRHARRVIDRPRDIVFLGDCPDQCGAQLAPERDATQVHCPNTECEWTGTMADIIAAWLVAGDDRYLTEAEIRLAIPQVTHRLIDNWVEHDGIARQEMTRPRWTSTGELEKRPVMTYRLGSVRERWEQHERDQQTIATERSTATYTSRQVATLLGLTESGLRNLVQAGKMEPLRRGAKPLLFPRDRINAMTRHVAG